MGRGRGTEQKSWDTLGERCPLFSQAVLTSISQPQMKGYKTNVAPRPYENIHPDVSGIPACL